MDGLLNDSSITKSHWLYKIVLISILVSAVFTYLILKANLNNNLEVFAIYLVPLAINIVLLSLLVTKLRIAVLVAMPQVVLIYYLNHLGTFFSLPTPSFITTTFLSEVRFGFYVALFLSISAILETVIYKYLYKRSWEVTILIAILLMPIYFGLAHIGAQQIPY